MLQDHILEAERPLGSSSMPLNADCLAKSLDLGAGN
jgi:hypothetical protein